MGPHEKQLLVIGNDKLGRRSLFEMRILGLNLNGYSLALDCSTNISRIYRLIKSKELHLHCLLKMLSAEIRRKNYPGFQYDYRIESNRGLYQILSRNRYRGVYLFRAGLIINRTNLSLGIKFLNIHSANIPDYAGLCAIYRALKDNAFDQNACLHVVTTTIDDASEIVDKEPYTLDPNGSYYRSEETAYSAGMRLLYRNISNAQ